MSAGPDPGPTGTPASNGCTGVAKAGEPVTLRGMRFLATKRQRWVTVGILLSIIVIAVLLTFQRGPSAAERWMEARRAQGEKFTFEELGWEERPAFASSVMEVIEGAHGALARFHRPSGPSEAFLSEPPPGQAHVLWRQPHLESCARFQASWTLMEDQLKDVEPALAEVQAALQTIVRDPGGSYTDLTRRLNFVALREAAQVLADAVALELHRAQPNRALTNLVSLIRLSRQHQDHYGLVNQMIRVSITRLVIDMTWQALQWPGWTDAQLEALQQELLRCELLNPCVHAVEAERALGLHWFEALKTEGSAGLTRWVTGAPPTRADGFLDQVQTTLWRRLWSDDDLLFFLDHYQAHLEPMRALARGAAWAPLLRSLDNAPDPAESLTRKFAGYRYTFAFLSAMAIPNYRRALDHAVQAETRRRLALIAIALERYRLRHGEWPMDLETLAPDCIRELPLDPYSAQPFPYRLTTPGAPLMYSVGANGQDDGGSSQPATQPNGAQFSSRDLDLVWPRPVD